jgi:hypothetical protein
LQERKENEKNNGLNESRKEKNDSNGRRNGKNNGFNESRKEKINDNGSGNGKKRKKKKESILGHIVFLVEKKGYLLNFTGNIFIKNVWKN